MLNRSIKKISVPPIELKKGEPTFADNVLTLAGGSTLALGITIIASPITSRLFGPEAFGLASVFRSGATMMGMIACLRYEMAIVLPGKDEDAGPLFVLCCIMLAVMTALTAILTWLFGNQALLHLNALALKPYLWLLPICLFLLGLRLPLTHWYIRHKRFEITAIGRILSSFFTSAAEIGGGWFGFRTGGDLVVLRFLGLIISPAYLLWRLSRFDLHLFAHNMSPQKILGSAKQYVKFPLFDALSMLLNQLAVYAPVILLTAYFNASVCGFYTKANYLLFLPSMVLGEAVGKVFLQESSSLITAGKNLAGLVEAVLNRMITLGMLPFVVLFMIGPDLFGLFLGARWAESGVYVQILTPYLLAVFVSGSISTLFGTLARQELNLISNGLILIVRVAVLIYGGLVLRDARLTLLIFMVANVLYSVWRISLLTRAVGLAGIGPLVHLMRCIAYVIPTVTIFAAMKWWADFQGSYLVLLTPVCAIPYVLFVLRQDVELRDLVMRTLRRIRA